MNCFEQRKAESRYWFNKSSDLRAAAAALWLSTESDIASKIVNDCGLGTGFCMAAATPPVFHMLCGMAMELAFKALTVEKGGTVNEGSHKLANLVESTGLSYTPAELELLGVLTHYIVWAGRYPTPKKEGDMTEFDESWNKTMFDPTPTERLKARRPKDALDWASFDSLWSRAANEYYRIKDPE